MQTLPPESLLWLLAATGVVMWISIRLSRQGFFVNHLLLGVISLLLMTAHTTLTYPQFNLVFLIPGLLINTILYTYLEPPAKAGVPRKYQIKMNSRPDLRIGNVRRGVSVIGSAGSGK